MAIRFFDMFAGIGGFRSGLEKIGGFECVGFCEIDEHAKAAYEALYDTEGELYFNDARKINPNELPDIDLICGGFPCQSFSVAGKRRGFADDTRGTLFFEIARIAAIKRPQFLFLENVPGLLSHDKGRTFATILSTLDELGYDVAWQVCNSANFGVPQSRSRLFIIGYNREKCTGEVLAFDQANPKTLIQRIPGSEGNRAYSPEGLSCTLTAGGGGGGGKTGLYEIGLPIKVKTKLGYQMAYPGDSIDLAYPNLDSMKGREGCFCDMNEDTKLTALCRCITARQDSGVSHRKGEHSAVFVVSAEPIAILNPEKDKVRQNGRRCKNLNEPSYTLTVQDRHGIMRFGWIRRLMPIECWRLQGFTDEQFHKVKQADAHLYKMAGNAVSVPVISAIGRRLKLIFERNKGSDN